MEQKRTIERLWRDAVAAGRTTPAYLIQDGDEWKPLSWTEAAERVESYANGLLSLGVRKGDAFAILGSSRVEWALFDFALGSIGAIGAAIYANSSPKDAGYILGHSESVGVLCEDETQRAKVESVRGDAAKLRHVLTYADLDDLAARGRAYAAEHPNALREAGRADRGGRPLHLHLHVRDDRAAEGLHDLAPELLRDGRGRRRPAQLHRARRTRCSSTSRSRTTSAG